MNKYAVTAMLADAWAGKRIIIVERDTRAVREALGEFRRHMEGESIVAKFAKLRTANGAESVVLGAGWVHFTTPRSNRMRGLSADVVFIDNDAHRVLGEDTGAYTRFRDDVSAVLAPRRGEVVYS